MFIYLTRLIYNNSTYVRIRTHVYIKKGWRLPADAQSFKRFLRFL